MNASAWQPWISDALQAGDVTLTRARVSDSGSDLELRFPTEDGPVSAPFTLKKWDTVKPSTVRRLPELHRGSTPLLVVVDRLSEEAVERLREGSYSWLSRTPLASGLRGELRAQGAVHVLQDAQHRGQPPPPAGRGRPARAAGRLAQALFHLGEATQKDLGVETGLSQGRISELLAHWPPGTGVTRTGGRPTRWSVDDPGGLIAEWLRSYTPEKGITTYWYGLEPLQEQARAALAALEGGGRVSGGIAADILAPWALPRRVLIYSDEGRDLTSAGLVPSLEADATLALVVTHDPAVVPSEHARSLLEATTDAMPLPLADPLVVLADVHRSDDVDADQAAKKLQEALVRAWRRVHRRG